MKTLYGVKQRSDIRAQLVKFALRKGISDLNVKENE